jgi:hypothetical protein
MGRAAARRLTHICREHPALAESAIQRAVFQHLTHLEITHQRASYAMLFAASSARSANSAGATP